jgi:UPF0271 protein
MASIDLNADVGEGDYPDEVLLGIVTSCNIACGGHAGDADSMAATIAVAMRRGVAIGAHPGYPDREHFGRRSGYVAAEALYETLAAQTSDFALIAAELGAAVTHLKAHGALYHDASRDQQLAECVARVAAELPGRVALVGPPGSALEVAAIRLSLPFIAEAFVDRRYRDDGSLVPRTEAGAVLDDAGDAVAQALSLAREGRVVTVSGKRIAVRADTLCIHGDTPGAEGLAAAVRAGLERQAVRVAAPPRTRD